MPNGWLYWCWKKFYAVTSIYSTPNWLWKYWLFGKFVIQAICYHVVYSQPSNLDGRVASPTRIALSSKSLICGFNEESGWVHICWQRWACSLQASIICTDTFTGYPLTKFSICPFSDFNLTNDPDEAMDHKQWNQSLSKVHVVIETAFGWLKGRFPCLHNMPGHDIDQVFCTIKALMIIHNIVEEFGDNPETIAGFNGLEEKLEMSFEVLPWDLMMTSYIAQDLLEERIYWTLVERSKFQFYTNLYWVIQSLWVINDTFLLYKLFGHLFASGTQDRILVIEHLHNLGPLVLLQCCLVYLHHLLGLLDLHLIFLQWLCSHLHFDSVPLLQCACFPFLSLPLVHPSLFSKACFPLLSPPCQFKSFLFSLKTKKCNTDSWPPSQAGQVGDGVHPIRYRCLLTVDRGGPSS